MMIKKGLLVFAISGWMLCTAAGASAQSPAQSNPTPTQALLQKAQTLEQRGRIDLAAKVWQQVLLADPKDPAALAGLARFQRQSESAKPGADNSAQQKPAK